MSARKLQHEYERLNKKISEGLAAFEEIKDKIHQTQIASQKEKFENDLKKELKKLQRCRDQLKLWLADSSVKLDKNNLQENRTKIEQAMDDFKELERNSKIKQFSNEGLEMQQKKAQLSSKFGDPEKVQEACDYISGIIQQLNDQNDELDREMESLSQQSKKKGSHSVSSSIEEVKYKIDRNNTHIERLESVVEDLESDKLDPAKIDNIKDDLDYYVEMNQDEDYVEYDEFYDQLEVADDEDEDVEIEGSLAQMAAESFEEEERKRLELQQLGQQQSEQTRATQTASSSSASATNSALTQQAPHHKPFAISNESHVQPLSSMANNNNTIGNVNTTTTTTTNNNNANNNTNNSTASSSTAQAPTRKAKGMNVAPAPAPPPIISGNSYSNVIKAAQAASSSSNNNNNINNNITSTSNNANNNVIPTAASSGVANTGDSKRGTPLVNNNVPLATALATASTAVSTPAKLPPPGLSHVSNAASKSQSVSPITSQAKVYDEEPLNKMISNVSQSSVQTNIESSAMFGVALSKLGNIASSRLNDPLPIQSISSMLEQSLLNCPDSFDAEKPRQYIPQNVHPSMIDYPQEPMFELNSLHFMQKFDDDLLFYCFYYGEDDGMNNFAKWNAAKELNKRGWMFNTELSQWVSRAKIFSSIKSRSTSIVPNLGAEAQEYNNGSVNSTNNITNTNGPEESENGEVFNQYFDEKTWLIRNSFSKKV
ncbi:uncharacterized protein LODBEIA_P07140 [Lodderomyces beijingensis]|uniref:General negative regulator of transcription subunit n=1 Tax=Lodderomyces beijingensis TaxID=1775926 RepID=A0ABP0ZEA3_9ASCO